MSGLQGERGASHPSPKDHFSKVVEQLPKKRKRPSPVSIRFSDEELARLKAEAGSRSLNGYVRFRLFGSKVNVRKAPSSARPDSALLSRLLRSLGEWDLTWALKELELAVDDGVIVIDVETSNALRKACADIAAMRGELMSALGLRDQAKG